MQGGSQGFNLWQDTQDAQQFKGQAKMITKVQVDFDWP